MASLFYEKFLEPIIKGMNDKSGEVTVLPGWWEAVDSYYPTGRCFKTFFYEILELLPEETKNDLAFQVGFWAPEVAWSYISDFINKNVQADSSNSQSVAIYAKLCNVSEEEMRDMMIKKGN